MSEERDRASDDIDGAEPDDGEGWDDRIKDTANAFRKAFGKRVRSVLDQETIQKAVSDAIPKEMLGYVMKQVDAGKDEVVRITGVQIRKFLENLDIGGELQKVLTSVSFEVKTTVRFVPNDKEDGVKGAVKPDSEVSMALKQGDREVEVNASPGKVKAMREGLRSAVDSVFKTFSGDEEEEGEVRKRWNAMRKGMFAAVDTVTSAFDRDDEEDVEAERAAEAAAAAVREAADEPVSPTFDEDGGPTDGPEPDGAADTDEKTDD